jgi:hypothetical protein
VSPLRSGVSPTLAGMAQAPGGPKATLSTAVFMERARGTLTPRVGALQWALALLAAAALPWRLGD